MTTLRATHALGYLWLVALGLALLAAAAGAWAQMCKYPEHAHACDAFGYLQMAKAIRQAGAEGRAPDFSIETPHTRLLIEHMRANDVPPVAWEHFVAPYAHHYQPRADRVGCQYPPGTGLLLALFPEGEAVHGLTRAAILTLVAVGWVALAVAGWLRAWATGGAVVLALQFGLTALGEHGYVNYSVIAALVPLLGAVAALLAAPRLGRWGWAAALAGGCCFGLAVLVRVPVGLLLPGLLVLLVGTRWRTVVNANVIAFGVGAAACGLLPLAVHQHRVAGAWYLSTYSRTDNSPPTLAVLPDNVSYYFVNGAGALHTGPVLGSLVGFAGLAVLGGGVRPAGRLALSAAVLLGVSTAYFLTHEVTIPYYQVPAEFVAVLVLGLGGALVRPTGSAAGDVEEDGPLDRWRAGLFVLVLAAALGVYGLTYQAAVDYYSSNLIPYPFATVTVAGVFGWVTVEILARVWKGAGGVLAGGPLRRLVVVAAFVPGLMALGRGWTDWPPLPPPDAPRAPRFSLPDEMTDDRAWVFADHVTGDLWYYAGKAAHRVRWTDPRTRALAYRFIFDRGEPLYVMDDNPGTDPILAEIRQLGGTLEPRGTAGKRHLVRWPAGGPGAN